MPDSAPGPSLFVFDSSPEGRILLESDTPPRPIAASRIGDFRALCSSCGAVSRGTRECDAWAALDSGAQTPSGYSLVSRRDLPDALGVEFFKRAGVAFQMMNLYRQNRFCGVCGAEMRDHECDRARVCTACGNTAYSVLSPAIIVAVERDGMLLMGHNAKFPAGRYSVLAGFVELGESLEDAVGREIYEESRVRVRNVRYFGSQPWPFPSSMMFGFQADWESGEPTPGDGELTDVRWFARDRLPNLPPGVSIARRLIEDWLRRG